MILFPDIVSDACLLVRKDLFNKIEGYDESMLMYFTEDDLCLKSRKENFKVVFVKSAEVLHEGSYSTRKVKPAYIFNIEAKDRKNYLRKYNGNTISYLSILFSNLEKLLLKISGGVK